MIRLLGVGVLALVATTQAAAQTRAGGAMARAAATITGADVSRRVGVIAHDSMMGRDTPSRGLDLTAQYIADEFKRFGLKPGGENGTWFQRYPIASGKMDLAGSHVGFMASGKHAHATFDKSAVWVSGATPKEEIGGDALLVGGALDPKTLDASRAKDRVVLMVVDYSKQVPPTVLASAKAMEAAGARGFVYLSNRDSAAFARRVAARSGTTNRLKIGGGGVPYVEVQERAAAEFVPAATLAELRASAAPVVRPVPGLRVMIEAKRDEKELTAPNTIGILEGTDPVLKNEYIVFSAHMDHDGVGRPRQGTTDSIWNGADDDASGTVGIVELAEAFAQPGARPKRSLLFITVSGEEKGLWGSQWFSEHPTVPAKSMVANINVDMIGRNSGKAKGDVKQWSDTIVVIGKEHSDLGATLNRVNAAHPELRMNAIDDIWPNERFYFRSDHYNFARKGVPILFFFNGTHEDYHQPTDTPDKIDGEKEARILQLIYYLGTEIGNAAAKPQWKPESYKEIVEGVGGR
jgi:hypothetical protein